MERQQIPTDDLLIVQYLPAECVAVYFEFLETHGAAIAAEFVAEHGMAIERAVRGHLRKPDRINAIPSFSAPIAAPQSAKVRVCYRRAVNRIYVS